MDPRAPALDAADPEAVEFVRFCRARRRVGWPELYDEMWAVASRGLFRGYGFGELEERGIGFSLFGTRAPRGDGRGGDRGGAGGRRPGARVSASAGAARRVAASR